MTQIVSAYTARDQQQAASRDDDEPPPWHVAVAGALMMQQRQPQQPDREQEMPGDADPRQPHLHRDAAEHRFGPEQAEQDPRESTMARPAAPSRYATSTPSAIGIPMAPEKMRFNCSINA